MRTNKLYILFILIAFVWGCKQNEKTINNKQTKPEINQVLSQSISKKLDLTKELDKEILHELNLKELRLLRNEFFARAGYVFKSSDLNKKFSKYEWYSPKLKNSDDVLQKLNRIEKLNIELIKLIENEKKDKINSIERITFSDYLRLIPQLNLPIYLECDKIEFPIIDVNDLTNDTIAKYIPDGATIVGKLYDNGKKSGIIYSFPADILVPFLYEYENENLISTYQLYKLKDCIGNYEGDEYQTYTKILITNDLIIDTEIIEVNCKNVSRKQKCDTIRTKKTMRINTND